MIYTKDKPFLSFFFKHLAPTYSQEHFLRIRETMHDDIVTQYFSADCLLIYKTK